MSRQKISTFDLSSLPFNPADIEYGGLIAHNTFLASASGNVGVGTTSPSAPFHVNGASAILGVGEGDLETDGTLYANVIQEGSSGVLNTTEIDTSSEIAAIVTDETGTGLLTFATAPTFTTSITDPLVIGGTAVSSTLSLRSTSGVGSSDALIFQVGNNGATEAMRITTSGNVGIGTAGPDRKLHIASGDVKIGMAAAGSGALRFGVNGGTDFHIVTYNDATGDLVFTSDNSARDIAFNHGNLGIGTTSPASTFQVIGSVQVGNPTGPRRFLVLRTRNLSAGAPTLRFSHRNFKSEIPIPRCSAKGGTHAGDKIGPPAFPITWRAGRKISM